MGKARSTREPSNQPERKIGPFSGGISVAVWINDIETNQGARKVRPATILPRRVMPLVIGIVAEWARLWPAPTPNDWSLPNPEFEP